MQHNKLGNYNVFNQSELLLLLFLQFNKNKHRQICLFPETFFGILWTIRFYVLLCKKKKKSPHESLEIKVEIVFITIKYKYNSGAKNKTKN